MSYYSDLDETSPFAGLCHVLLTQKHEAFSDEKLKTDDGWFSVDGKRMFFIMTVTKDNIRDFFAAHMLYRMSEEGGLVAQSDVSTEIVMQFSVETPEDYVDDAREATDLLCKIGLTPDVYGVNMIRKLAEGEPHRVDNPLGDRELDTVIKASHSIYRRMCLRAGMKEKE